MSDEPFYVHPTPRSVVSEATDRRRFRQFRIFHLLAATLVAAVVFAVLAPQFRQWDIARQLSASVESVGLIIAMIGMTVSLVIRRSKVDRQAGPPIQCFERRSSRALHWLFTCLMWSAYAVSIWIEHTGISKPGEFRLLPGSPILLLAALNYAVVRVWWKIDPMGLEACEHGLIVGAFQFHRWDAISRYSWSGKPPRQLNLFLKQRLVLNLKTDAALVQPLNQILAQRISAAVPNPDPRDSGTPAHSLD